MKVEKDNFHADNPLTEWGTLNLNKVEKCF